MVPRVTASSKTNENGTIQMDGWPQLEWLNKQTASTSSKKAAGINK